MSTNGTTAAASDELIDNLYAFWPGLTPAPAPCPEACFSLTLKGTLGGVDALLTIRGQTPAEFTANLQHVKGLLDPAPPAPPRVSTGHSEGWCAVHDVAMQENTKDGRRWFSHKTTDGWCKGKTGR